MIDTNHPSQIIEKVNVGDSMPVYITRIKFDNGLIQSEQACRLETTAKRLSKSGLRPNVTERKAYLIDGVWYSPVHIQEPNNQDTENDIKMCTKNEILGRMLDAGLTMDEIRLIQIIN